MKPQSRPGCNPGGGSFAPGWSLYSLPGLFSVHPHRAAHSSTPGRWTAQPPRVQSRRHTEGKPPGTLHHSPGATPAHSRHRGRTEPRNRARVQGHKQAPKQATEPPTAAHRRKQSTAPETNTAGNARKSPTEPPRAGVLSLYYPPPKRPTAAHRAAHRGQAARGIETPGRASPQPPQPRRNTPSENPGVFR